MLCIARGGRNKKIYIRIHLFFLNRDVHTPYTYPMHFLTPSTLLLLSPSIYSIRGLRCVCVVAVCLQLSGEWRAGESSTTITLAGCPAARSLSLSLSLSLVLSLAILPPRTECLLRTRTHKLHLKRTQKKL